MPMTWHDRGSTSTTIGGMWHVIDRDIVDFYGVALEWLLGVGSPVAPCIDGSR